MRSSLHSRNMSKSGMSDLADRKRPTSTRQHLSQAGWMAPIQMEQGLRGGMLLDWALKGDSIWGIAKGLTSRPGHTHGPSLLSSKLEIS